MSPAVRARKWIALTGLLCAFPALLWSQTNGLQGGDLPFTPALAGDQVFPSAALGANGGFLVWHDNKTDPSGLGVSMIRFDAVNQPIGNPVGVNQTLGRDQQRAKVAMLADGGGVIVFQNGKPGAQNVSARFVSPAGAFTTGEILVNNTFAGVVHRYRTNWTLIYNNRPHKTRYLLREVIKSRQEFNASPVVTTLNDGSVVVAYNSSRVYTTNTFGLNERLRWDDRRGIFITNRTRVPLRYKADVMQDVYVQRLSGTGQKLGEEFRANQFVDFNQRDAAIAALDNGNFVVAWASELQRTNYFTDSHLNPVDLYARVFDNLGNPLGNEFRLNTTNRSCGGPTLAATSGGAFTVAWTQKDLQRSNGLDIAARTFDSSGGATSDAFVVNSLTYGDQYAPSIASVGAQQVVVWTSMGQDSSREGVFAQALNGSTPVGAEFRVNVSTRFSQFHPRIAGDNTGRALVVWSGYALDSGFDLFGRNYVAP